MKTLSTHDVAERLGLSLTSTQRALLRDSVPIAETVHRTNYYLLSDVKAFEQLRAKRKAARRTGNKPGRARMNRPDKASTQFLLDAIAPIEAEALNGKNWQTRITNSQVRFLIEKFREALADRDQLEQQLAESPREITGDQLTKDMLVWEEHSTVNWQLPSQALLESSTYNQQKYIVKPKPVVEDETFNIGSVQIEEEDQHSHSTVHCTGCKELVDSRTRIALKYV